MSIKKSSVRPSVRLSAVLAVVALAAAACGGGAATTEGAPAATVGPEGAAAVSAPATSPAVEGGGAVSSPATTPSTTAPVPVPAPTMTDDEYDETIGRELAELDEPAGPPPDNEDEDQDHEHDGDGHDHDDGGDPGDGGEPATGETPDPAEETETATATTVPAADDPQPDPEPVVEPEPDEWQDTAPVLEPVDAADSGEIRNLHEYRAFTDANYVYLDTLLCDPQPGFCNEHNQEYLALVCVNPIGQMYPGLRMRNVFTPLRNPITGDLVWVVTFNRVTAIEDHTGSSIGSGRLQYVHVAVDRWNYQYFSETEPAEYSAWMDAFPMTAPHETNNWHSIVEVPDGHARDIGNRITLESEGRPNPCEGEYSGA